MSSILILLFLFGTVLGNFKPEREFEIKQESLLKNHRNYIVTETGKSVTKDDSNRYIIQNDLLNVDKKLVLLEKDKPLYELKHKSGYFQQKWVITDAKTDTTIGTLKHRPTLTNDSYKLKSSKYGTYRITGNFSNRTFSIKNDGRKVAEVHNKSSHLHDIYSVQLEADQDSALILLLTIGIDEIRQH